MNNYLEEIVKIKLLKIGNDMPLTSTDFEKITELGIDNLTFSDEPKNIDLIELLNFRKIKDLTLQNFDIGERELKILKSLVELDSLQLVSCNIDSKETYKFDNLQTLSLINSNFKNLKSIKSPESITIRGNNTSVNLDTLQGKENIKYLRLNNIKKISGINCIKQMEKLEDLNIDGTKVNSEEIKKMLNDGVKFSHADESLLLR